LEVNVSSYYKIIGLTGSIYTREFQKIKNHKNKVRVINEETVIKSFKNGETITVYFEEKDEMIELDNFSDQDIIKKLLGKGFLD
jgi:ribosomal protein L15